MKCSHLKKKTHSWILSLNWTLAYYTMNTEQASESVFTRIINRIFNMSVHNKEIKKEQHVVRIFPFKDLERVIANVWATIFLFKWITAYVLFCSVVIRQKSNCLKKEIVFSRLLLLGKESLRMEKVIAYKKTDEWYIEWQRVSTNDNEWQRVVQRVKTNDNEWQRVVQRVTRSDNEWQQVTTSDNK